MIRRRALRLLAAAGCLIGVLATAPDAGPKWPSKRLPRQMPRVRISRHKTSRARTSRARANRLERIRQRKSETRHRQVGRFRPAKLFSWAIGKAISRPLDGAEDPDADEIETDRPDFTQNRKTVGRGVVQLESGMTYLHGPARTRTTTFRFPKRCCAWAWSPIGWNCG